MKRLGIFTLALTIAASLTRCNGETAVPAASVKAANAPVILISIDTLRSDHLPMYGYSGVRMPLSILSAAIRSFSRTPGVIAR